MGILRIRSLEINVDPLRFKFSMRYRDEMGVASSDDGNENSAVELNKASALDNQEKVESEVPSLKKLSG